MEGGPDPEGPGAWHVEHGSESALAEGRIWPQSSGSQLAGLSVGSGPGDRVLDLCAAPGGKTAQLVKAGYNVTALERDPTRVDRLRDVIVPRSGGGERGERKAARSSRSNSKRRVTTG